MSGPLVSTVVLTRDRPEALRRCLGSLRANSYRPLEIVISDNGSEAGRRAARDWLAGWGADPARQVHRVPARRIRGVTPTQLRARGRGVRRQHRRLRGRPDMLERVVRRFQSEPDVGMIGGRLENIGFEGAERYKGRGRPGINGRYGIGRFDWGRSADRLVAILEQSLRPREPAHV